MEKTQLKENISKKKKYDIYARYNEFFKIERPFNGGTLDSEQLKIPKFDEEVKEMSPEFGFGNSSSPSKHQIP